MPFLGAHESVSGGLYRAFDRIESVGGKALQIFTRNQRQWKAAPVTEEEAGLFAQAWRKWGDFAVASHASYLINLATPKAEGRDKGVMALAAELERCQMLGIRYVVIHPGSHTGSGVDAGVVAAASAVDEALSRADAADVRILLENTAGQGTSLGADFTDIAGIIERSAHADKLGMCFDTCHAFAAGHDLRTGEGYAACFRSIEELIGLDKLMFFHLNDSKQPFGSRKDRHEHIGKGELGPEAFRQLLNDPRFADRPMVLETDKDEDLEDDRRNLEFLNSLLA